MSTSEASQDDQKKTDVGERRDGARGSRGVKCTTEGRAQQTPKGGHNSPPRGKIWGLVGGPISKKKQEGHWGESFQTGCAGNLSTVKDASARREREENHSALVRDLNGNIVK